MADDVQSEGAKTPVDWGRVVNAALAGDRAAYARLARRVTGHLARWRAYDFRPDWDDMVQEVLISVVAAHREGRLDAQGALPAYLRQATRFKFIDRIRLAGRRGSSPELEPTLERGEVDAAWPPALSSEAETTELRLTLARAVESLPDRPRRAVLEVHVRGRTYEEAAEATGIPLGSLKRALREGLALLRESLDAAR